MTSTRPGLRAALRKETFHLTGGVAVGLALLFLPFIPMRVFLGGATLALAVFEVVRFASPKVNTWVASKLAFVVRRGEEHKVTGTTYFAAATFLATLAFPKYIAVPAVFFLALGDPMGTVVGMWQGRTKLFGKSFEGDIACLVTCLVIAVLLSWALPDLTFVVAASGAAAATVLGAVDLPLNDNLTIALGSGFVMWLSSLI